MLGKFLVDPGLQDIILKEHTKFRMKHEIRVVRVRESFVKDCLDVIIKEESDRGRDDTSYSTASEILRIRIMNAGGIKHKKK